VAEQEPELEEEQEAKKGAGAEEAQSPPPITGRSLQEKISEDIDLLFSPATAKRLKEGCNNQRGSPSTVASKKLKTSRGTIGEGVVELILLIAPMTR
jgi:hypothetical protein